MSDRWDAILRQIRRHGAACQAADADDVLLARFTAASDPAAFEVLLSRYGPMVYGVCRRSLRTDQDAEDAFQATFLALVRAAPSVRRSEAIGSWLHKTALRMTWRLRAQSRRRLVREQACARPEAAAGDAGGGDDLRAIVDEELGRLPAKYRRPVVLCRLLERPLAEAAAELGLSVTTVWRRLGYAEGLLRHRLGRRGLSVPAGVLVGAVGAAVPASAAAGAVRSAVALSTGRLADVPARPLSLALRGPGHPVLLGSTVFAAVAGLVLFQYASPPAAPPRPAVVAVDPGPPNGPAEPRPVIAGQVVDSAGRPVPWARVAVLARRWERGGPGLRDELIVRADTGPDGRFRAAIPPAAGRATHEQTVQVVASPAEGRALAIASVEVLPGGSPAPVTLRLPDGRGVSGRVIDRMGDPVAGAVVVVTRYGGAANDPTSGATEPPLPDDVWPAPVVTTAEGTFALPELDPGAGYRLAVFHRHRGSAHVFAGPSGAAREATHTVRLIPIRRITGQVFAADTGAPVPHARVGVTVHLPDEVLPSARWDQADRDGRFSLDMPEAARYFVRAAAADPTTYLSVEASVTPPGTGAVPPVVLKLPRGVTVTGRVAEAGTGRPVPRAKVWFVPKADGQPPGEAPVVSGPRIAATADADGRVGLPVPPGEVTVLATAPGLDYVPLELDAGSLEGKGPDGRRLVAHAAVPVTADPGHPSAELNVQLTPGTAVESRAVFPDGSPVTDGYALCLHVVGGRDLQTPVPLPIRDGRFVIPGCRPGQVYAAQLIDRDGRHGAVARVRCPDQPGEPAVVRLAPCGEAVVDLTDPVGRPVAGCRPTLVTRFSTGMGPVAVIGRWWAVDPVAADPPTGTDGRVTIRGLIPGAPYQVRFAAGGSVCYAAVEPTAGGTSRLKAILPGRDD
jgi:RNA polymerase sigma factor (sigma-70 family)